MRTLQVVVPMPGSVQRVSCSYPAEPASRGSQSWDWQERQRRLVWKFKKVPGGTEHTLQVLAWLCSWKYLHKHITEAGHDDGECAPLL